MIVIDASIVANAIADDGSAGDLARRWVRNAEGAAPALLDAEVLSVLRRKWMTGDLDDERFDAAVSDLVELPVRRYPLVPIVARASELRDNLTAYDAMYVALAEALGATLITADRRLASAPGTRCAVEVVSAPA